MRTVVVLALLIPLFAGCLSNEQPTSNDSPAVRPLDISDVPANAVLEKTAEKATLVWQKISLPFAHTFPLPEGATMVRFVADPGPGATIGVSMVNEDTGRRRCNQQSVVGYGQTLFGARSCGSITALDLPGDEWTVRASGPATADLRLEFLVRPVDGIAGMLNLSELSHATHELKPTTYQFVNSFDGAPLWVEVTLPEGEGPWPTVIASSPYNGELQGAKRGVVPAMWTYWTQDWAKRGYAAVNVDVRGYGMSGGCVEVWGENEQKDQAFIVDWVDAQPWSDGSVGFYGQSYVGTTPVEAAIQNPKALKAIIAVAPVINSYEDWHYGGVPNGESSLSPVAYQVLTATPEAPSGSRTDLDTLLREATSGICDPTLIVGANSPTAEYNDFYEVRDFKKRAGDIQAAVLFTEGFEDVNVKSAMIPGWFNEINAPKLGVFGHWLHQHPARMDQEVLFVAWMDHYVKGKDMGFDRVPNVVVSADATHHRMTDAWPPVDDQELRLAADFQAGALAESGSGTGQILLTPVPGGIVPGELPLNSLVLRAEVAEDLPIVAPSLVLKGTAAGENGFVYAELIEEYAGGGQRVLTWGMLNLALRNGYDSYEPLIPGAVFEGTLPFRPTEHIVAAGSTLRLSITGVPAGDVVGLAQPQPVELELDGAGTVLVLPTVEMGAYEAMPVSALP